MNRLAVLALPLLLLVTSPARAADRKFDPEAAAKAVAPFLDRNTVAVFHADLTRVDVAAIADWLAKLAKINNDALAAPKKTLGNTAETLTKSGAKDVFLVFTLAEARMSVFIVIPVEQDADGKKIAAALLDLLGRGSVAEVVNNAVTGGEMNDLRRLKTLKPEARPEVAKGFAAVGDGVAHAVLFFPPEVRKVLEEDWPNLSPELGGDSIKVLTGGVQWAAFKVEAPPKFQFTAIVQASDNDAAKALNLLVEKVGKSLAGQPSIHQAIPNAKKVFRGFLPELVGDRLTLTVDEKLLASLVEPIAEFARKDAPRAASMLNLRQLGLAMINISSNTATGDLLPVANFDAKGKPLLSWRVHILPYIEQGELYKQFKLDEPWDSEHNKKLITKMPKTFANPSNPKLAAEGKTTYLAPVHKEAIFTGDQKGIRIFDITDGTSLTVMLVDAADDAAVIWTKPDDLKLDPKDPAKGLSTRYGDRFMVVFADGSADMLPSKIEAKSLWALFTRAGGEPVERTSVPGLQDMRWLTSGPRLTSTNNLRMIGIAMFVHQDATGTLPAVANFDAKGKPLLSWRVHLLPYLDQNELYQQFKLDEPWDSEHNKKLIAKMPKIYANPSNPKLATDGKTTYLAPVHKEAAFPGNKEGLIIPSSFPDGASTTILLVDAADDAAVIWTKPDDLKLDPKDPHKGLAARHKDSYLVLFADSSVKLIPKTIGKETMWALFTRAGGEVIKLP